MTIKKYSTLDFIKLDNSKLIDDAFKVFKDSAKDKRVLQLDTIATHSGKVINDRVYPGKYVKDGAKTFFKNAEGATYNKPFLKNHERSGDPIGRVISADYKNISTGSKWFQDYLAPSPEGSGYLITTSQIQDDDSIEKFLDGRYATVSISGEMDGAFCSTCTKQHGTLVSIWSNFKNAEDEDCSCEHFPGKVYKINDELGSEKNYIITGKLSYDELSQVNVPADDQATHVMMKLVQDSKKNGADQLISLYDNVKVVDPIISIARFSICDAQGKSITGLEKDTYRSTKTTSLPVGADPLTCQDKKDQGSRGDDKNKITDEKFAKAIVLDHFSKMGVLKLTDEEKGEVEDINKVDLSDAQKVILKSKGHMVSVHLPFKLYNESFVMAYRDVADRLSILKNNEDKIAFMSAIEKQMEREKVKLNDNYSRGDKMLTAEQEKALMVELEDSKKKIKDLDVSLQKKTEEFGLLQTSLNDQKVDKIVKLRKELGFHDAKGLKDEELNVLKDTYKKHSGELLAFMLKDLEAQKAKTDASDTDDLGTVIDPTKIIDDKDKNKDGSDKDADKNKSVASSIADNM